MEELSLELVLVSLILITVLTILLYLIYSGLFTSITVSTLEPETGSITFAYKTQIGAYKDAGALFTEAYCLLPDKEQLGIYYDDPEAVPSAELRCAVGPVLAQGDQEPLPEEMEKMEKNGFKIVHFPKPSFVVTATFPFTTTISIYLGIYRVYPKLRDYIQARKLCAYPALEIYTDSSIVFMMPLSKQDEFFVSEFQEDDMSIATTDVGERDAETADAIVSDSTREIDDSEHSDSKDYVEEDVTEEDTNINNKSEQLVREDSSSIHTAPLTRD